MFNAESTSSWKPSGSVVVGLREGLPPAEGLLQGDRQGVRRFEVLPQEQGTIELRPGT